tara:strand:- start:157632 stop:158615 length:984 start_codon:yes stop_codon:yes gene_type:complete
VVRSSSTLLFALVLFLSFALVLWWTTFLLLTSGEMTAASDRLLAGDTAGVARALGAKDAEDLAKIGSRRQWMFASEGAFFVVVLLGCGWLYLGSVRRETALRRYQDRFLAAATHELKTPLATISLLLESLREDRVPPEKRHRYLTNGLLEAERLERGLHNVLTAAGLRSTGKATRPTTGNLADDVRQAVEAMQARAHAADVQLEVAAPESLPAPRDVAALQLVLRNLLDNAVKFSPPNATVHVTLAKNANEAHIIVRDAGRGLDNEELSHAFEPFFRGDDKASGGTGLGLHLVHEMVHAHGGSVTAESIGRDQGSTFTVRLPLEKNS